MAFFDRQIKIFMTFYLVLVLAVIFFATPFGYYFIHWYEHAKYDISNPKNDPIGKINLYFTDSLRDTWNRSNKHPYKDLDHDCYDLRLMSELPKNQVPLPNRIYVAKETANILQYVTVSNMGKKVEGILNVDIGLKEVTKPLLASKKAAILNIIIEGKQIVDCESDYEMCLTSELTSNQEPLSGRVYFEHPSFSGMLKCMVLSSEGEKLFLVRQNLIVKLKG